MNTSQQPNITIWIAARNEEETIINCLNSINKVNYPKEKLYFNLSHDS